MILGEGRGARSTHNYTPVLRQNTLTANGHLLFPRQSRLTIYFRVKIILKRAEDGLGLIPIRVHFTHEIVCQFCMIPSDQPDGPVVASFLNSTT